MRASTRVIHRLSLHPVRLNGYPRPPLCHKEQVGCNTGVPERVFTIGPGRRLIPDGTRQVRVGPLRIRSILLLGCLPSFSRPTNGRKGPAPRVRWNGRCLDPLSSLLSVRPAGGIPLCPRIGGPSRSEKAGLDSPVALHSGSPVGTCLACFRPACPTLPAEIFLKKAGHFAFHPLDYRWKGRRNAQPPAACLQGSGF